MHALVCGGPKAVQRLSVAFKCVNDVHGGNRFSSTVLRVHDGIPDDVLQENFQNSAGFVVHETTDAFYATASGKPANGWFCYSFNAVMSNFLMAFYHRFLASFSTA